MSRDKQISFIIGGILSLPIQKYKKNNIKRLEIHICLRWISITHGSVVAGVTVIHLFLILPIQEFERNGTNVSRGQDFLSVIGEMLWNVE